MMVMCYYVFGVANDCTINKFIVVLVGFNKMKCV